VLSALLFAASLASAQPERDRYVISATLDPEAHTVEGEVAIELTNRATVPIAELWFHLYLNAFASDETVFIREGSGRLRGVASSGEGKIEIGALSIDGRDALGRADLEVIDGDRTQMRVPLETPLAPGGAVRVQAEFVSTLPPVFARSGYSGSFHMVAQWFPKLAVLDRDGRWHSFPYHARGEFFAAFADYDLTVVTPSSFVVGATGRLVSEEPAGATITRRFLADGVHDTAFAAYDEFEEATATHEHTTIRLLYPPGYDGTVSRHLAVVERGLERYGALFGDYPYSTLTVIVPPRGAEGAAGMEYPTLFLTSGPWIDLPGIHAGAPATTAHELGHQWFQGLVATNEVEDPALDEGLTQWATGDLLDAMYGERSSAFDALGIRFGYFDAMRRWSMPPGRRVAPPLSPAYTFGETDYGRSVYGRTSIVLETVGRTWGPERLEAALGRYAREQRFRHPTRADLYRAFDATYWRGFSARVLAPALERAEDAEIELLSVHPIGDDFGYRIEAIRRGPLPLPISVRLVDDEGRRQMRTWPSDDERLDLEVEMESPLVEVVLDPHEHDLLDASVADNRWSTEERGGDVLSRLLFAAQHWFGMWGP
jgi:hypothetical protein